MFVEDVNVLHIILVVETHLTEGLALTCWSTLNVEQL